MVKNSTRFCFALSILLKPNWIPSLTISWNDIVFTDKHGMIYIVCKICTNYTCICRWIKLTDSKPNTPYDVIVYSSQRALEVLDLLIVSLCVIHHEYVAYNLFKLCYVMWYIIQVQCPSTVALKGMFCFVVSMGIMYLWFGNMHTLMSLKLILLFPYPLNKRYRNVHLSFAIGVHMGICLFDLIIWTRLREVCFWLIEV